MRSALVLLALVLTQTEPQVPLGSTPTLAFDVPHFLTEPNAKYSIIGARYTLRIDGVDVPGAVFRDGVGGAKAVPGLNMTSVSTTLPPMTKAGLVQLQLILKPFSRVADHVCVSYVPAALTPATWPEVGPWEMDCRETVGYLTINVGGTGAPQGVIPPPSLMPLLRVIRMKLTLPAAPKGPSLCCEQDSGDEAMEQQIPAGYEDIFVKPVGGGRKTHYLAPPPPPRNLRIIQ